MVIIESTALIIHGINIKQKYVILELKSPGMSRTYSDLINDQPFHTPDIKQS